MSTKSSKTTGILRSQKGCSTIFPFKWWYLGSSGWTATAVSPSIVSIRVVATTTSSSKKQRIYILKELWFCYCCRHAYLFHRLCKQKTPKLQTPLSLCNQEQAAKSFHSAPFCLPTVKTGHSMRVQTAQGGLTNFILSWEKEKWNRYRLALFSQD